MALDVSKAFVVTFPLRLLLPPLCAALAGLLCVLGHIFPVFLRFRGGKGTACLCGTVLGPDAGARAAAAGADVYHRHDLEPGEHPAAADGAGLCAALPAADGDWRGTIALALIFPAMLWAHRSNFARWREGKEQTFRQFLFGRHEPQREEAGE